MELGSGCSGRSVGQRPGIAVSSLYVVRFSLLPTAATGQAIVAIPAGGLPAAAGLVCYEAASALYPHSVGKVFRLAAAKSLICWSG